jgi:hypothetical protein
MVYSPKYLSISSILEHLPEKQHYEGYGINRLCLIRPVSAVGV